MTRCSSLIRLANCCSMSLKPIFHRQFSHSECGPVALQIVLSCFGDNVGSDELVETVACGKEGWTVDELCEVAKKWGVQTTVCQGELVRCSLSILPIIILADGHYVVVYKFSNSKVYLADPIHGKVVTPLADFLVRYSSAKTVAIVCSPSSLRLPSEKTAQWGALRCFNYLSSYFRASKYDFAKLFAVIIVVGCSQFLVPFISRAVIDDGLHSLSLSFIKLMSVASAVLMLSSVLGSLCQSYIGSFMTFRVKAVMLVDYFSKINRMVVEQVYRYNVGDIMQRLHDSERVQTYLANVFFPSVSAFFFLIIYLSILFYFNQPLFWVAFAIAAVFLCVKALFLKERKNIDVDIWNVQAKCNKLLIQCYSRLSDVKLFGMSRKVEGEWCSWVSRLQNHQLTLFRFSQVQEVVTSLILRSKDILMTYLACSYVISGELTIGGLFAVQYLAGMLNGPLNKIAVFLEQSQVAMVSMQRISIFESQPDEVDPSKLGPGSFIPKHKHITLSNLSYRYPDGTVALRSVSMRFMIGQKIGIVGKSGCGKSTLLKLICGIVKPTTGDIFVGSANVNSLNWHDLRRSEFCAMLQGNSIFEGTILDNIICSNDYDETRLVQSVEIANIRDEIEKLPMAYKTIIGDGARSLSTGQIQRLLIARAVYQESKVYLFDEMANGLSIRLEKRIVKRIDTDKRDALRIYVTHRADAIEDADLILVFDEGRLVDMGKHDELMNRSNYYKTLSSNE